MGTGEVFIHSASLIVLLLDLQEFRIDSQQ